MDYAWTTEDVMRQKIVCERIFFILHGPNTRKPDSSMQDPWPST